MTFLLRRALDAVAVVLLVSVGIFALTRAAPGGPLAMMASPSEMQGGAAAIEALEREFGLDRPIPVQYLVWLSHAVRGDLGYSYFTNQPVLATIAERAGASFELMVIALLIGLITALPLGIWAAARQNRLPDYSITTLGLAFVSIPTFFLGIAAIYVFSVRLGVLPAAGQGTPGVDDTGDHLRHLVLPSVILGLSMTGQLIRYVRAGFIDQLHRDYIRTALAKGASTQRVLMVHTLRNAVIQIVTIVAVNVPHLLGGAIIIEQLFSWPGLGQLAIVSIGQRDYPVIIGLTMYVAVLVVLCNLAADLLASVIDPRVERR